MLKGNLTFTHPGDLFAVGNRRSGEGRPIVSSPADQHHTRALHLPFCSKSVLILARNDLHTLRAMIHLAMVHAVLIAAVDVLIGVTGAVAVDMHRVIRRHT